MFFVVELEVQVIIHVVLDFINIKVAQLLLYPFFDGIRFLFGDLLQVIGQLIDGFFSFGADLELVFLEGPYNQHVLVNTDASGGVWLVFCSFGSHKGFYFLQEVGIDLAEEGFEFGLFLILSGEGGDVEP